MIAILPPRHWRVVYLAHAAVSAPLTPAETKHWLGIAEDYGLEAIGNRVILTGRSINSGSDNAGLQTRPVA
jgi:hypothetical protein